LLYRPICKVAAKRRVKPATGKQIDVFNLEGGGRRGLRNFYVFVNIQENELSPIASRRCIIFLVILFSQCFGNACRKLIHESLISLDEGTMKGCKWLCLTAIQSINITFSPFTPLSCPHVLETRFN